MPVDNAPAHPIAADEFVTFMHAYKDMVFSIAARLTGNDAQAEDISQEVFLRAYEHFGQLRTSPAAGGWLKTVAMRMTLNHLSRYRKRWRFFSELRSSDEEAEEGPDFEIPSPDSTVGQIDAAEQRALIEQALKELPEHQRVPLVLYHFQDLPYEEIARLLHISLSKLKTDILRGRAALARQLARRGVTRLDLQEG
jgi:RNA polymerase sigma-70 factor (ECF subfamily)